MSKVGERIRALRNMRGLTQTQLADAISQSMGVKMRRSALGNYERGIREPDLDTIEAFADFFNTSVSDLMGRDDSPFEKLNDIGESMTSFFPKYDETRIVSAGMDKLPKEQRERVLAVVRAMFANDPNLFNEKG